MEKLIYLFSLLITSNLALGQFTPPATGVHNPIFYDFTYYYGTNSSTLAYRLKVTYKNGNTDTIVSKFHTTKRPFKVYLKDENGTEIFPKETVQILARKKNLTGYPFDSLWLFPINRGKITTYYYLPDTLNDTYEYIQKGAGPIEKFSNEKFKSMISDNEKALKIYNFKKHCKHIGWGMFLSGAAILVGVGVNGSNNPPLAFTGAAIGGLAVPILALSKNRILKTIKVYNQ